MLAHAQRTKRIRAHGFVQLAGLRVVGGSSRFIQLLSVLQLAGVLLACIHVVQQTTCSSCFNTTRSRPRQVDPLRYWSRVSKSSLLTIRSLVECDAARRTP